MEVNSAIEYLLIFVVYFHLTGQQAMLIFL